LAEKTLMSLLAVVCTLTTVSIKAESPPPAVGCDVVKKAFAFDLKVCSAAVK
jgi:hypothetical protein